MNDFYDDDLITAKKYRTRTLEIGARLRNLRLFRGLKQADVIGDVFGDTRVGAGNKLSVWETGDASPMLWRFMALMDFYGHEHIQYVLTGKELLGVTEQDVTRAVEFLSHVQRMLNISDSERKSSSAPVVKVRSEDVDKMIEAVRGRLRQARQVACMTLTEVAEALGVSTVAVHKWETTTKRLPLDVVLSCAALYRVNVTWLITGEGMPEIEER